jgi:DNA-binding MarR family transcriptional regulator
MQELARGVFLSKSGLTQVATRMEAAGLIRREICPSDRRGVNAVITAEGRGALRRASAVHLRGIERHFTGHLDEAELRDLAKVMARIFDAEAPAGLQIPGRTIKPG